MYTYLLCRLVAGYNTAYRLREEILDSLLNERQSEYSIDGWTLTRLTSKAGVNQFPQLSTVATRDRRVGTPEG